MNMALNISGSEYRERKPVDPVFCSFGFDVIESNVFLSFSEPLLGSIEGAIVGGIVGNAIVS